MPHDLFVLDELAIRIGHEPRMTHEGGVRERSVAEAACPGTPGGLSVLSGPSGASRLPEEQGTTTIVGLGDLLLLLWAASCLFVPGAASCCRSGGSPRVVAVAGAPGVTLGILYVAALVGGATGLPYGLALVGAVWLLLLGLALVVRRLPGRDPVPRPPARPGGRR